MTRHGKIARLPRAVREKLNERLDNGEPGVKLAKWLNGLPQVKKVLQESFGGRAIRPQNLSEWKCGGFREWQARQETLEQARELSAQAQELNNATERRLTDNLATVLAARYAKVLSGWDGKVTEEFSTQLRALRSMCLDVAELRRGDHSRERVVLEQDRLNQNRERKERELYEIFKQWASQPAVRNCLCKDWETLEQKEERLEEIFGQQKEDGDEERSDGVAGEEEGEISRRQERADEASATPSPSAGPAGETIRVDPAKADKEEVSSEESARQEGRVTRITHYASTLRSCHAMATGNSKPATEEGSRNTRSDVAKMDIPVFHPLPQATTKGTGAVVSATKMN
jgi:hypothetical protein